MAIWYRNRSIDLQSCHWDTKKNGERSKLEFQNSKVPNHKFRTCHRDNKRQTLEFSASTFKYAIRWHTKEQQTGLVRPKTRKKSYHNTGREEKTRFLLVHSSLGHDLFIFKSKREKKKDHIPLTNKWSPGTCVTTVQHLIGRNVDADPPKNNQTKTDTREATLEKKKRS